MTRISKSRRNSAPPAPRSTSALQRPPALLALALCVAAALTLYWGTLAHPQVFDDRAIRGVILGFTHDPFVLERRWLSNATFAWISELSGGDWRWQRAANFLLHAATGAALFLFLDRLFGTVAPDLPSASRSPRVGPRWIAFFGVLLFLLHPAAVYGVAYLVQRSIVLATFFSLVTLRLFLEGLTRKAPSAWYIAAAIAYLLAVFSKEHCVALPAVAAALAVLVRGPSLRLARELALPFALFAGIAALILFAAHGSIGTLYEPAAGALLEQERDGGLAAGAAAAYPLSVVNQAFLFFRYLATWLLPYTGWMSVDVRVPFPTALLTWPQTAFLAGWLAWPVAGVLFLRKGGRVGLVGLGLLYPWLLALTEIAAIRVQEPYVIYRSYLWMTGLPILLAPALARFPAKWVLAGLSAACLAFVPLSRDRIESFSSQVRLWDDAVRKNAGSSGALIERGYHNRGLAYLQAGQYPDALRDFERALQINERDVSAWVGRATLFARTGSLERAMSDLERAVAIDPTYAEAWGKRCFTRMLLDRPRDALPDCERAVALAPRHRDGHTNLGVVYAALNRTADAEASYRRALALDPRNGDAHYNYGVLLFVLNRREEARDRLRRACDVRVADACRLLEHLSRTR
jgi:protein O-mannosyl-transferase